MALSLRPYQLDIIDRARSELKRGVRRLLIQAPTGAGKTCLVAQMLSQAAARGKRAWFVVHRRELIEQSVTTFVDAADLHVGIIAAGAPADKHAPVQVCAVQSLRRRLAKHTAPDLVVWDECHHLPSKSWADLAAALPGAVHIGLTATPTRLDGRGLRPFFDALLCGPSTADLIAQGYLSDYRLYAPAQFDASKLHTVAGDYNRAEVSSALSASTVVGDAVGTYQRHAEGGRALVFAWSLNASRDLAAAFTADGIPASHVDGETPAEERAEALRRFRAGELRVLCNCELFGEGLDVPSVDAVFLLRPTQSLGLYLQQCGRGLRPSPGKAAVRLFDHVGNYERHGLPDDPRTWTLDGIVKQPGARVAPVKRCLQCFGVASATRKACPYCGAVYAVKERKVTQIAGELAEITAARATAWEDARGASSLAELQAIAKRCGYKPGWAWFRWKLRHSRPSGSKGQPWVSQ